MNPWLTALIVLFLLGVCDLDEGEAELVEIPRSIAQFCTAKYPVNEWAGCLHRQVNAMNTVEKDSPEVMHLPNWKASLRSCVAKNLASTSGYGKDVVDWVLMLQCIRAFLSGGKEICV